MQTRIDTELVDKVKSLCQRDQKYMVMLHEICKVDEIYENDSFGWQFKDVQWSGAHCNVLMQAGILKHGYKSNSATHYRVACDRVQLMQILEDVEHQRIESETIPQAKEPVLNPSVIEEFEKLIAGDTDMLEYWSKSINPKIEGLGLQKKAILLCIASHSDKFGDRGRVHVLMWGDPGSAKSQLMGWVVYQLGAHQCSQRTSKVGLTADASGNELTPGALPRAHKGILCADELDKFNHADRQGLLESMEEGKIHIEVGKISATLDAETRIIGGANTIENFSPELLDRFDFKFEMRVPTGEGEKKVTCSIVDNWFAEKPGWDGANLRSFINWIRDFEPSITVEVREKTKLLLCMYLDLDEGLRGSPRKKESVMRLAYTIAKLHKRNVEVKDIITAITLLNPNLNGGKLQALEQLAARELSKCPV